MLISINSDIMILNKEILKELVIDLCVSGNLYKIDGDMDYLYDMCLDIDISGLNPETNVIMYGELCSLLNRYGYDIGEEIDNMIEESEYFGDPAFTSTNDYWNYILN